MKCLTICCFYTYVFLILLHIIMNKIYIKIIYSMFYIKKGNFLEGGKKMNKKIIGILVCMLLIATAFPAVTSLKNNNINATFSSAPLTSLIGDWTEGQKLFASDIEGGDNFGWTISLSGDTALIGASL